MKIQDQTFWVGAVKMKPVNAYAWRYIEIHFVKWHIVPELKVEGQLFGFENKPVLDEINKNA